MKTGIIIFMMINLLITSTVTANKHNYLNEQYLYTLNNKCVGICLQSVDKVIEQAIRNGQAGNLARYFFDTIELIIPDSQGSYSKSHAEQLLRRFFQNYPAESFVLNSESSCGNINAKFFIGTYVSKNEHTFRTYYQIKTINNKDYITVLKFEQ
jgi:hypothetical protein